MSHFDLGGVKTLEAVVSAQQRNRTFSPDESFMREPDGFRINLAIDWPTESFSHSLDPERTSLTPKAGRPMS
jgi:hypothetical protein